MMTEKKASEKRPRDEERVGNLGWLATSGALPRKKQDIEGVSGGSILELQAQLYRAQENAKLRASGAEVPDRRASGFNVAALMKGSNAGVEERDRKDRLEVKTTADRVGECYAALERKAQLYERLARGEVDDDEEQFEVDFLRKGGEAPGPSDRPRSDAPLDTMLEAVSGTGGMLSADMQRERDRRAWEQEQERALADEEAAARRRKQKEELLSLGQQTREERQRAEALKARKEEATRSRREDLKQKFLRDQIAKKLGAGGKATGPLKKDA